MTRDTLIDTAMSDQPLPQSEIILYQTEDGRTRVQCRFENETLWLTQAFMAELFQVTVPTVNEHSKGIYAEGELAAEATIRKFRIVRSEGCRERGLPEPEMELNDGFVLRLFRKPGQVSGPNGQVGGQVAGQVTPGTGQVGGQVTGQVEPWIPPVLKLCESQPRTSREIQAVAGISHRESFQRNYLDLLVKDRKWLAWTIPDKPTSRLQKYRLTPAGAAILARQEKAGSHNQTTVLEQRIGRTGPK
jgi:hypothetical protein